MGIVYFSSSLECSKFYANNEMKFMKYRLQPEVFSSFLFAIT